MTLCPAGGIPYQASQLWTFSLPDGDCRTDGSTGTPDNTTTFGSLFACQTANMKYTCEDLTDTDPYGIPAALWHADPAATRANTGFTYEQIQVLKKLLCTTYTKQIPAGPGFNGGLLTLPECNYDYDASPAVCPTALLSGAPIPFQGGGTAWNAGTRRTNGHLKIWGHFTLPRPVRLNQATLTLTHLLEEMAGAGALLQGLEGVFLLPMSLQVRARSTRTEAAYETPPGVRPLLKVAVKTQDPETRVMKFAITVYGAVISEPTRCADAPTTELATTFGFLVGSEHVLVGARLAWACHRSILQTPSLQRGTRGDFPVLGVPKSPHPPLQKGKRNEN